MLAFLDKYTSFPTCDLLSPDIMEYYICGMDNLFNSQKFAIKTLNESGKGVMTHSVCQQSQGIPQFIVQDTVTKKMSY